MTLSKQRWNTPASDSDHVLSFLKTMLPAPMAGQLEPCCKAAISLAPWEASPAHERGAT
jgi:hypothetical protein